MHSLSSKRGFTLMELVIVLLILSILSGVIAPKVAVRQEQARDARRLTDLRTVQAAVEQFYLDFGRYPEPNKNSSYGGWDVSHDGDFIPELVEQGYLGSVVTDPLNDGTYHYRYYVYNRGSYGCETADRFYVLGIRRFERPATAESQPGHCSCSGRDWGLEFDQVVTGG